MPSSGHTIVETDRAIGGKPPLEVLGARGRSLPPDGLPTSPSAEKPEREGDAPMVLGGVAVEDRLVRGLASLVDKPLGTKLETALLFRAKVVGLTKDERAAVLKALENAPGDLRDVRDLLLTDENWQLSKRLR
jgi:hypothetical protein